MKEDEMGVACSIHGEMRNAFRILVEKPEGRDRLGDTGIYMRTLLKLVLKK
jgi:hypothetical protein